MLFWGWWVCAAGRGVGVSPCSLAPISYDMCCLAVWDDLRVQREGRGTARRAAGARQQRRARGDRQGWRRRGRQPQRRRGGRHSYKGRLGKYVLSWQLPRPRQLSWRSR